MTAGTKICYVCGKEKELKHIDFANIDLYIECECEKKEREKKEQAEQEFALKTAIRLRNRSSHLSPVGQSASFDTLNVDEYNEKAIRAGEYILKNLLEDSCESKKNSLVLQGNRGSGKTYISTAVINDFNKKYPVSEARLRQIIKEHNNGFSFSDFSYVKSECKFITEMDLFSLYYDNFNFCKVNSPVDEYKKAEKLLVIDDVGSANYEKSKIQAMYHNILDYRYTNNLSVIATTNLQKKELSEYIGERAFDRLQARSYFIDLTSPGSRRS